MARTAPDMIVKKGRVIRQIDEILSNTNRKTRKKIVRWLEDEGRPLSDTAIRQRVIGERERAHAEVDALGQGEGWWGDAHRKEETLRAAYLFAEKRALAGGRARPIRTLWITASAADTFQCFVYDTGSRKGGILVFWITPPAREGSAVHARPERTKGAARRKADLWIVGDAEQLAPIAQRYEPSLERERCGVEGVCILPVPD